MERRVRSILVIAFDAAQVLAADGRGLKPIKQKSAQGLYSNTSRKLRSAAGAECVIAPTETKSAPASA